jgi:Xaa-Pro aminopeptidase
MSIAAYERRAESVRSRMSELGFEALLISLGADLPWLTGYEAMPLERLTMLVLPADSEATLVVPALEAPRVEPAGDLFDLRPWAETEDPVAIVAGLVETRKVLGASDRMWAAPLLALQARLPGASFDVASRVTGALRAVKDAEEVRALERAAGAADRVAEALVRGEIRLVGRTELAVSDELASRLRAEGHNRVNFAIVASGPNSASAHHEPGGRVIEPGDAVVCDFGGVLSEGGGPGYCSDITRTVVVGEPSPEMVDLYSVLREAQAAAVADATVGRTCEEVDATARDAIAAAGYGENFVHRTGHGIGLEEHEDPYLVAGNRAPVVAGHAFSVEPGIYLEGRLGARIEDIVVATEKGPRSLNRVDRSLAVLDG